MSSRDNRTRPPILHKEATERWRHGERVPDPYAWLSDRKDPRVLPHLEDENAYTERSLAHTDALRRQLYNEILDRVDLNHSTVPVRHGPYEYYSRNEEDKSYPIHCRRLLRPDAPEDRVLDENGLAEGNAYFALEFLSVSPDHSRCAFAIDTSGDERLSLFIKELTGERCVIGPVPGAVAGAAWASDSQTFFSIRLDDRNRPFQLVRHRIAEGSIAEDVIFEEEDEAFRLRLSRTETGHFLILTSWAHDTTELHYLSADEPSAPVSLLHRRKAGVEVYATHHGESFYILTNQDAPGKKIIMAPISDPISATKSVFVDARADVEISYLQMFANHLVVCERRDGLPQCRIIDLQNGQDHLI